MRPEDIAIKHAPVRGSSSAPVTIVEFSDFECGYCGGEVGVLKELLKAYPNRVRWFFKHYPLPFHKSAPLAHEAALAASEQGKFWEMHDLLFEEPQAIAHDDLVKKAKRLNLDTARFEADLDNRQFKPVVEAERQEGMKLGVDGTGAAFSGNSAMTRARAYVECVECSRLSKGEDQQYLADGMTEALITNLGQASPLRVIARTSVNQYQKTKKSIREIARELNADVPSLLAAKLGY